MNVWILGWLNVVLQILSIDHWPDEWLNKWKNVWILGWLNVEKRALILNEWMNECMNTRKTKYITSIEY